MRTSFARRRGAGAPGVRGQPDRPRRALNWRVFAEVSLLGGLAALLLAQALRGTLSYFIHPRYTPMVVAAALVLLLLLLGRLRSLFAPSEGAGLTGWLGYALLALPLLVGLLLPTAPLGAGALSLTGFSNGDAVRAQVPEDGDSRRWNLLQWVSAASVRGDEVQGREADVIGFVHHDPGRPFDGFFVARLVVVCCVADGSGVSLPVVWPGGVDLAADTWVRVRGRIGMATIGGRATRAILATEVVPVPRPDNPYLNP